MNPWGLLIAGIGFVTIYVAMKGNPKNITTIFKPQNLPTPTGGGTWNKVNLQPNQLWDPRYPWFPPGYDFNPPS